LPLWGCVRAKVKQGFLPVPGGLLQGLELQRGPAGDHPGAAFQFFGRFSVDDALLQTEATEEAVVGQGQGTGVFGLLVLFAVHAEVTQGFGEVNGITLAQGIEPHGHIGQVANGDALVTQDIRAGWRQGATADQGCRGLSDEIGHAGEDRPADGRAPKPAIFGYRRQGGFTVG